VGKEVFLGSPFGSSVLGTGNLMMAAVLSQGITTIDFSACEPELVDLAVVLKKMGADIQGEGTPQITIRGKKKVGGFIHRVIPDRIEAGSFMVFGLVSGGSVTIEHMQANFGGAIIDALKNIERQDQRFKGAGKKEGKDKTFQYNYFAFPGISH
jgi:UDP-N-acetylglucosamine 1-carboxyvinyltransferase